MRQPQSGTLPTSCQGAILRLGLPCCLPCCQRRSGSFITAFSARTQKAWVGKGTLSFKWRTSSESNYDKLHFIVDGTEVTNISGERSWATYTRTFSTDGSHTVEWKYDKDDIVSKGGDCGWIDDVVWTPAED